MIVKSRIYCASIQYIETSVTLPPFIPPTLAELREWYRLYKENADVWRLILEVQHSRQTLAHLNKLLIQTARAARRAEFGRLRDHDANSETVRQYLFRRLDCPNGIGRNAQETVGMQKYISRPTRADSFQEGTSQAPVHKLANWCAATCGYTHVTRQTGSHSGQSPSEGFQNSSNHAARFARIALRTTRAHIANRQT